MHFKQNVPSNPLGLGSGEEVENAKRGVRQVGAGEGGYRWGGRSRLFENVLTPCLSLRPSPESNLCCCPVKPF